MAFNLMELALVKISSQVSWWRCFARNQMLCQECRSSISCKSEFEELFWYERIKYNQEASSCTCRIRC